MKKILTPLGRIAIIKSLLVSKLNYLFLTLPNPPGNVLKELNKMLFKFLWSGKPDKIKRSIACKSLEDGGLGMVDIYDFIRALKLRWVRCLFNINDDSSPKWKSLLLSSFPKCMNISSFGSVFPKQCSDEINNYFWKDCIWHLKHLLIWFHQSLLKTLSLSRCFIIMVYLLPTILFMVYIIMVL